MMKVERKEVAKDDRLEKTESDTNHGDHESQDDLLRKRKEKSRDYDTY